MSKIDYNLRVDAEAKTCYEVTIGEEKFRLDLKQAGTLACQLLGALWEGATVTDGSVPIPTVLGVITNNIHAPNTAGYDWSGSIIWDGVKREFTLSVTSSPKEDDK